MTHHAGDGPKRLPRGATSFPRAYRCCHEPSQKNYRHAGQSIGTNAPVLARGPDRGAQARNSADQASSPDRDVSHQHHETSSFPPRATSSPRGSPGRLCILALVPIVSACTLGWSNRPDRIVTCSITDPLARSADRDNLSGLLGASRENDRLKPESTSAGVVVLSIEPAVVVPGTTTEAAVVFPGYVLPDDSREDSLHEGS